jgi:hypothetical protein
MAEKYYCVKCYRINENDKCEHCKKKNLRIIKDDDIVYLTTKNFVLSGILDDMLTTENIKFMKKGQKGAGLSNTLGIVTEMFDYYIIYSDLEKALEIVEMVV